MLSNSCKRFLIVSLVIMFFGGCIRRYSSTCSYYSLTKNEALTLEKLVEQGGEDRIDAARKLVDYYSHIEYDIVKINRYLRVLAKSGFINEQYYLANNLLNLSKDKNELKEAVYWLNEAAESGLGEAQIQLGELYEVGVIIEQNYYKAKTYYEKAAFSGQVAREIRAMEKISEFYSEGKGCARSVVKAYAWLLLAKSKVPSESFIGRELKQKTEILRDSLSDGELKESMDEFETLSKKILKKCQ